MKTLPFNLDKALAGEPVVARGGTTINKVIDLTEFGYQSNSCILALTDSRLFMTNRDGKFGSYSLDPYDLFMLAPEPYRVTSYHAVFNKPTHAITEGYDRETDVNVYYNDIDQVLAITREQRSDGTWKIIGDDQLEAELQESKSLEFPF